LIQDSVSLELGGAAPSTNGKLAAAANLSLEHLQVTLAGGFTPAAGQSFDILDWGSISAPFGSVSLPSLVNGLSWNTSLLYTTGVISVSSPVLGDYNQNGIVDAADYTVWRDTVGSTADLRANGDNTGASAGKIDSADYAVWKSQFGAHSGSGAGSTGIFYATVPEPTAWLLSLIATIGVGVFTPMLRPLKKLYIVMNGDSSSF
jgi:hypothetical protein